MTDVIGNTPDTKLDFEKDINQTRRNVILECSEVLGLDIDTNNPEATSAILARALEECEKAGDTVTIVELEVIYTQLFAEIETFTKEADAINSAQSEG